MAKVFLVPHDLKYAKAMSTLSSASQVKDTLGLTTDQASLEGTNDFIRFIIEQERVENQYSRVILNENEDLIGVITLKEINPINKTAHIGTWIGHQYWGKGYNLLAKKNILYIAFTTLHLEYVFAGAKLTNIRSQKAQEKLPFVKIGVQDEFPIEHQKIESQVKAPCILNVIEKEPFLKWYSEI